MNIFLRELKANLKSLLIWSAIIFLLIMIALAKFSAFAGDPSMLAMLDSIPEPMLDALNMRAFNLTTLSGFYGVMFIYFGLMGAIAAAMWGSDIVSKEERDKTVEFSLVQGQEPIVLRGRTAWFRLIPDSEQYDLGIAFLDMTPKTKLRLSTYISRYKS